MNWLTRAYETARCGIRTYVCAKFDKNPNQCLKESKCPLPPAWITHGEDRFDLKKEFIQEKEEELKRMTK